MSFVKLVVAVYVVPVLVIVAALAWMVMMKALTGL